MAVNRYPIPNDGEILLLSDDWRVAVKSVSDGFKLWKREPLPNEYF
jgi:hypothetical protein